jgi:hypothetical protein
MLVATALSAREKTDVVTLKNGDTMTGEIKRLERAKLRLKTDYMETVYIEWDEVKFLMSTHRYEVELESGVKYYGSLGSSAGGDTLIVRDEVTGARVAGFWSRVDGSGEVGVGFTQANEATEWWGETDWQYRGRRFEVALGVDSYLSEQDQAETISRHTLTLGVKRFIGEGILGRRWFYQGVNKFEKNDELGLDLRTTLGGGFGRHVIQNNLMILSLVGGGIYVKEEYEGEGGSLNSAEALLGLGYSLFTFDQHETEIEFNLSFTPSLSESGRIRLDLDTSVRRELVKDFFVEFSLYERHDSDPPQDDAESDPEKNDWGTSTSLGYSF